MRNSKIRKQVYELTIDDFQSFPIWEYALDEEGMLNQDECTVRPCEESTIDSTQLGLLIRAKFKLKDDTLIAGFMNSIQSELFQFWEANPVLLSDKGQVDFWYGAFKPSRQEIEKACSKLGKTFSEIFPIEFIQDKRMFPTVASFNIPGFLYLEKVNGKEVVKSMNISYC